MLVGALRSNPTRFDPVTISVPWMKNRGRLKAEHDPCGGDQTNGARRRIRRVHDKREFPIPRCLGCDRQVRIITDEDLQLPLCDACAFRGDDFLARIAMKLAAFQTEERLMREERVQELVDFQFGAPDSSR